MLQLIPINKLNDYWNEIRLGLWTLLNKAPDLWKVEDVYMELMSGRSWLYVAEDEDGLIGFTVLTPYNQYGDEYLHIWIAVNHRNHDDLVFCTEEIKRMAEQGCYKYVTYSSSRKGSLRACKELGFTPSHQHYRYEV